MKVCTTCGREWDTVDSQCPDDGGLLSAIVSSYVTSELVKSGARPALQVAHDPDRYQDDLEVGLQVGEYQIERKIGVGGMGVVYGARHPVIGKRAAIKVLNARLSVDREAVSRFVLEAQAVNQIGHANIVDIFSFGTLDDGRSYFVMEWLQGETLGERLDHGRLTVRESISILVTLCRALEAAHAAGVVHRDLKPDNVFLANDDEGWRVKLLDFGIAKLQTANPSISKTATGMVVGTPLFMAPEQAKGEPVDGRTDVYALGLLAYTMVCGTSLFESESSAIEVLSAHLSKPPPPPRTLVPELPVELDQLILEMVEKRPAFRPTLVDIRQRLTAISATVAPQTAPVMAVPRLTVRAPSDLVAAQATQAPPIVGNTHASADDGIEPVVAARGSRWAIMLGAVGALAVGGGVYAVMTHDAAPPPPRGTVAAAQPPVVTPPPPPVIAPVVAIDAAVAQPPAVVADAAEAQATAELAVQPADAQLTVDGTATALQAGHATLTLAPGEHVAIATARGRTAKRTFKVSVNRETTIALEVPAAPTIHHPPTGAAPTGTTPKPPTDIDGVQNPFPK